MESPPRLASQNYVDDAWRSGSKGTEGQPALCLGVAASSPPNRAVPERKEKERSKSKEKEKSKKPWAGRLMLGVAAAVGVVGVVAAGASILLSATGDSVDHEDDSPRRTMKAPGSSGQIICRDRFEEDPKNYFRTQRLKGPKAAVDRFQ